MDRVEKLTIRRSLRNTVVRLVVTENGITVDYSLKTPEYGIPDAIHTARRACTRLMKLANEPVAPPTVVSGGPVTLKRVKS